MVLLESQGENWTSRELSHAVCVFTLGCDHTQTTIELYMYKDLEGKEIIKAKLYAYI